ncbi:MAG: hypothetical protein K5925_05130 [Bacilli bacterium]|nr:hypothetical protein [Bacilli bacterium]
MKNKKILWIALISLDVAVTVFLFVIHIIMLSNIIGKTPEQVNELTGLVGTLAKNTTLYLCAFVIPTFVILAANIVGLVIYVRKQTKKEAVKVEDLTDEQKEALKQELLKDLNK